MRGTIVAAAFAIGLPWAQTVSVPAGSLSGVVAYEGSSRPVERAQVSINPGGSGVQTDSRGQYSVQGLAPGSYRIQVNNASGSWATRVVTLVAAEHRIVDFQLPESGSISGRVVDSNKEPLSGIAVSLVAREYSLGELRYVRVLASTTNDRGEYKLSPVLPRRGYLVFAGSAVKAPSAISNAPLDISHRKQILTSAYYPDTDDIEGAGVITLRSGEHLDGIDIRMAQSPSFCVDGVLEGPDGPEALTFYLDEQRPADGVAGGMGMYKIPKGGVSGADGRIRVCDLHRGDYVIRAFDHAKSFWGIGLFTIADRDARGITIQAKPRLSVPGEVVWAGPAPDKAPQSSILISLWPPLGRMVLPGENLQKEPSIPGTFAFDGLFLGDYPVTLYNLPRDMYVRDITYSGRSVLHKPLVVGSATGQATLRILIATDGSVIQGRTTDKDGNPVPDSWAMVLPERVGTVADLADAMETVQSDQNGAWHTEQLAPEKYYVLASLVPVDHTPECMERLWNARKNGHEVDLAPGTSVQVTVQPMAE
jgi:hypothetical protein